MGEDPGAARRRAGTVKVVVLAVVAVVLGGFVRPALDRYQVEREAAELANDPEKRLAKESEDVRRRLASIERRGTELVSAQEKEEIGYQRQANLFSTGCCGRRWRTVSRSSRWCGRRWRRRSVGRSS